MADRLLNSKNKLCVCMCVCGGWGGGGGGGERTAESVLHIYTAHYNLYIAS